MIPHQLTAKGVAKLLPQRPKDAHKGTFGKVLILGGSKNYPGAPHLAALASLRVGAGLVTIATTEDVKIFTTQKNLEFTYLTLPENGGFIAKEAAEIVTDELSKYDVLLLGPGLGKSADTQKLVEQMMVDSSIKALKLVIDADGLNLLSQIKEWWSRLKAETILTPHPGEMSRLTGLSTAGIQKDRINTALANSKKWGQVIVLKGANTVIASPEGEVVVAPFANPLLATAGTGDVLAGAIGGFLAQGLSAFEAACVGVYVHGLAAQNLRKKFFDTGMVASDLLSSLPQVIKRLKQP